MEKPFQGIRTFLKASQVPNSQKIAVLGIPFDCATTNRPGARFGPSAIRDASLMLTDGYHPIWNVDPKDNIVDLGDVPVSNTNINKSLDQITQAVDSITMLDNPNSHLISLGGDHAVSLGILRSLHKRHGKIAVVHFDAHADTSLDHLGDPIGHGTWMRNAIDEGLVDATRTISIGVRAPSGKESRNFLSGHGGMTISARDAMNGGVDHIIHTIHRRVGVVNHKLIDETPVYLSFDVDSLDPAQAPGTGTPEVGGLTSMFALEVLEGLRSLNWIGMDVVEVSPSYDHSQITALAAATIAWTYACMITSR